MPLNEGHVGIIQAMVGYILEELPSDSKELSSEIIQIKQAFSGAELKPDDTYRFLQNLTECLPDLEKYESKESDEKRDNTLKIGEVKSYLLEQFDEKINAAAKKANLELKDIWDKEQLQKIIKESKDFNEEFKTIKARPIEPEPPYSIPRYEGEIFRGHIVINNEQKSVDIHLEIQLTPKNKITYEYYLKPLEYYADDRKQDAFFKLAAKEGRAIALDTTIDLVLNDFVKNKIITRIERIQQHPWTQLLALQFYIDALRKKEIKLEEIISIGTEPIALAHPVVMKLIKEKRSDIRRLKDLLPFELGIIQNEGCLKLIDNEKCDIDTLLNFGYHQIQVLSNPYYFTRVYENKTTLEEIRQLTVAECKNLYNPAVINLQKENKINFKQAKRMTSGTRNVINHEFYSDKIKKGFLSYEQIDGVDDITSMVLKTPEIINLIANKIENSEDIFSLSLSSKQLILEDYLIRSLIKKNILTLKDLNHIKKDNSGWINEDTLCDIISTSSPPSKEKLSELQIKSQTAYVRYGEKLFYINKNDLVCKEININKKNLQQLDEQFNPTSTAKSLSEDQLEEIALLTGCVQDKFQNMDKKQLESFELAMKEAVSLAKSDLFYDSDIHYLYENFLTISNKIHSEVKEEKSTHAELRIFKDDEILNRCTTNIRQRIQSLLDADYTVQEPDQVDSIEKIISDCRKFNIDITHLRSHELDKKIESYALPLPDETLSYLFHCGKKLAMTKLETLEHILGLRLESLYNRTAFKVKSAECIKDDSLDFLLTNIKTIAKNLAFSTEILQCAAIRFLLGKIKDQIQSGFSSKKMEMPEFFKSIHNEIISTENECYKVNSEEKKIMAWDSTFKNIVKQAKSKLHEMVKQHDSNPKNTLKIKPRYTLFLPNYALNSSKGLEEFCEKIKSIEEFIPGTNNQISNKRYRFIKI